MPSLAILVFLASLQTEQGALSIEAIFGDELSVPSPSEVRWTPDGNLSYFLSAGESGRDLWLFDTTTGEKHVLVGSDELRAMAPSATEATTDERERTRRTRFQVPDYHWAPVGESLLFTSSGQILVHDVRTQKTRRLAPDKTPVLDPKFSPDGRSIAFLYEHDLWVVSAEGAPERRLTFGGSENVLHGELDWVYPEELDVRTGYSWSPDSRRIAYLELDETLVPTYPITEEVSRQATVDLQRYPKPGDPNPRVRVGIVDVATARTVWIDRADEYIPRVDWVDADRLSVQLLDRDQERLELIEVDPVTGRSRSILVEESPYWINVSDDLSYFESGSAFLWTSERTGFRHIYLYRDGKLASPLTKGDWQVDSIAGLDEANGVVYFTANRDNPIGKDFYRVNLDGSNLERLTDGIGTHDIDLDPSFESYLDEFSSMTDPGGTTLRRVSGNGEHAFHEPRSLDELDLVKPEWRLLDTPDGAKIGLLLMKPRRLEPGKKYPLVVYVYGMPGVPTIRDSWAGSRYLFHQFLVQQGYVVAQIDDRTS
ncbi:MAG TPA: DPP IV N-terminal domain-containing protein, partial [Vicinamibacteria bacterium]|nr:DPP IV N-terminal domain-containing protein [Vicinamibacteria bacterium]